MFIAGSLNCNEFRKDIEAEVYQVNQHDICTANKIINGKKHTFTWHDDDAKASTADSKGNDEFY